MRNWILMALLAASLSACERMIPGLSFAGTPYASGQQQATHP
ncbi:hypothetical protein [Pelagibius marinus]|nr:hypothetical protein [Pelagibius marinus]